MNQRLFNWLAVGSLLALAVPSFVQAADHRDSPSLANSAAVGSRDLNDVYIFQNPSNPDFTVIMSTVNPFAGVLSPTTFEPGVLYDICIDNDGDALADIIYRHRFFDLPVTDTQFFILQRIDADSAAGQLGIGVELAVGFTGESVAMAGGGGTISGLYDDPFFFDLNGFNNGFQFTGDNFFADANTSAMIINVPSARLTKGSNPNIGVWCRTLSTDLLGVGAGVQFDRNGRPAINTALIPRTQKNKFNTTQPVNDQRNFRANVVERLKSLGRTAEDARGLADVLLPDIMTFDTSSTSGFLNGRRLEDDVIDIELNLLTNGAVTGDGVDGNDLPFRNTFPFLAPAQPIGD